MTTKPTGADRFEGFMLVLILLGIGAVSAAASFTHIHDWTMTNSPAGTGDWFGWANAVVSDLVPLGVGLEVRRRRRHNLKIGAYPISIILAAATLSLAGQLAEARPSITGWILAAVPALGFLSLTKLVLSRPTAPAPAANTRPAQVAPVQTPAPMPVQATLHSAPVHTGDDLPEGMIPGARIIADAYRQATGHPINREALSERLRVPLHTAERLLNALTATEPHQGQIPARLNGNTPVDAFA
jgi:hypothetical protein